MSAWYSAVESQRTVGGRSADACLGARAYVRIRYDL
jgi:hypothetical protein